MKIKRPVKPKAPLMLQPGDIIELRSTQGLQPHVIFKIHGAANLAHTPKPYGILNITEGYTHTAFFSTMRELTEHVIENLKCEVVLKDKHDFTLLIEEKVEL